MSKKISVVAPMYNEELAIKENVRKLVYVLEELERPWELVLVNDGSTDKTLEIVQRLAQQEERIKLISYQPNRGRGFALKMGFQAAQGDYIIATESDLNWGTEIIKRFVEKLDTGDADIVIASPHMKGGKMVNVPFLRWLLSYLGNKIFASAFTEKLTMMTGMTRGYRKEVLHSLELESSGKDLHVEILSKASDLGYKIIEIPTILKWKKKEKGVEVRKSHFKMKSIYKHLILSIEVRPYLLFGSVGFTLIVVGGVAGLYLLNIWLSGEPVGARPMLFFSVLSIIIGVQVLLFGFLATQGRDTKRQLVRIQKLLKDNQQKNT
jgi:dolichol-phosphate mannosyltransferase